MRSAEFDTVLGTLEFDDRGDVTDIATFSWYVWTGGEHVPVDPAELTE